MIRIEDIRSEPTPVKEWVLRVDQDMDDMREMLLNNMLDESVYDLMPTEFSKEWGLFILKPIDIPSDLEPNCLNCKVTSDTWGRLLGYSRCNEVDSGIYDRKVLKAIDDILNARIRHYPNMLKGEYLLERFFIMREGEECKKLLRMGTFHTPASL
jgi:hypothetical protein